jgi:hypothetical protein
MGDRRAWLAEALGAALSAMHLVRSGELTYNTYGGSVGTRVLDNSSEPRWLRVGRLRPRENPREGWETSAAIPDVAKPMWFYTHEFEHEGEPLRADLLSLAPSPACTSELILTERPPIGRDWFTALRCSIDALERWPTQRVSIDADNAANVVLGRVGSRVPRTVKRLVSSHTDMHWCNITAPVFSMLDWDSWGLAPYGYGPATAYCSALLVPDVADEIYNTFVDQFETTDGRISLIMAADHLLWKVGRGDYPSIADALHRLIGTLVE